MTVHFHQRLDQLKRRSIRMASNVEDMLRAADEVLFADDVQAAREIIERDASIDEAEVAIEAEAIELMTLHQPVGRDIRVLATILKVNNDLERIADCVVNIAERAKHLEVQPLARRSSLLSEMAPAVRSALRDAVDAYANEDVELARRVVECDDNVDCIYAGIVQQTVKNAPRAGDDLPATLDVLSAAKNLERIADHATNIAEDVIYLVTGDIVRHAHDETDG